MGDSPFRVYKKQITRLTEYKEIFRETMLNSFFQNGNGYKILGEKLKKEQEYICDMEPSLIVVFPDTYVKEDVLAKYVGIPEHSIAHIRTEKRRRSSPYVLFGLQSRSKSGSDTANAMNLLEQVFFFIHSRTFPSKDVTFQKIIS